MRTAIIIIGLGLLTACDPGTSGSGCERMCEAIDSCQVEPGDTAPCIETCEGLRTNYDTAGCAVERDAFVHCIAGEFERTCSGGCNDEATAADECVRLAATD